MSKNVMFMPSGMRLQITKPNSKAVLMKVYFFTNLL